MCAKVLSHDFLKGTKAADTNKYSGISSAVAPLSGASLEECNKAYNKPLSPMKEYANSVQQMSGASLKDFNKMYDKTLLSLRENEGVQTSKLFMNLVEKGLDISEHNEIGGAYSQNDVNVKADILEITNSPTAKEVAMYALKNNRAKTAS